MGTSGSRSNVAANADDALHLLAPWWPPVHAVCLPSIATSDDILPLPISHLGWLPPGSRDLARGADGLGQLRLCMNNIPYDG